MEAVKPKRRSNCVRNPASNLNPTSAATAMADKQLITWLKQLHQITQLTLSVCSRASILGATSILNGHPERHIVWLKVL
jgi:transcriptional regulator GlxA family with amidase domain